MSSVKHVELHNSVIHKNHIYTDFLTVLYINIDSIDILGIKTVHSLFRPKGDIMYKYIKQLAVIRDPFFMCMFPSYPCSESCITTNHQTKMNPEEIVTQENHVKSLKDYHKINH